MAQTVAAEAHPSLALIKYWGKKRRGINIPASPSIAVTLGGLTTTTVISAGDADRVVLDGNVQDDQKFSTYFAFLRKILKTSLRFDVESNNNFPTAAGLASSSSGFAALAAGCSVLAGAERPLGSLSALARIGSASAARAVFGGFTLFPAGAKCAEQLYPPAYWPELRILVAVVTDARKPLGSREAMALSRETSPFFKGWTRSSQELVREASDALKAKDIEKLGDAARLSFLRMHAVMLASDPPVRYFLPGSMEVLDECASLRKEGFGAWETMDAGPQVKILCLEKDLSNVRSRIDALPGVQRVITSYPGEDTHVYWQ